ncbi:acyl-CoA thioesterase [Thalassovita taeanensis]|uniref:Thioesterase-like superfamily protein n=1 Tax=Thalassovita taeanensis TaxID=657014 RepID=A0A1H9DWI7_9RHOB|nr:acyl-CoA thioesterase [Thalassovita taeanensis]SEQ17786.1 Thioesterase-like superfamily protein [Thalassovita taeanensis]
MYPILRLTKEFIKFRNAPALPLNGTHVSQHMCLPWDIDIWMELNNGRTLTLFDLGRSVLAQRSGLLHALRQQKWGMTMAGACVRYRRRIRMFEVIEMRSRAVCWDERFIYLEQSMWKKNGECANHIVYRTALTDGAGIVAPERVLAAIGQGIPSPAIPDWIAAWIRSEDIRPWPPMQD